MTSDLIQDALDWQRQQRREHLSTTVTYRRAGIEISVPATFARTRAEAVVESGVTIEQDLRDFIIAREDLAYPDGTRFEPQKGDEIEVETDDETRVFQVMPLGNEPHYRPVDGQERDLRIHTKSVQDINI